MSTNNKMWWLFCTHHEALLCDCTIRYTCAYKFTARVKSTDSAWCRGKSRDALSICEERKMATHAASCREVGVSFIPLAVESLGGWSDLAAKTISHIGRLLGQRLGIPPSITSRQLFQRCSVSLWRGNAALWLHRFPPISSFIDSVV